MYRINIRNLVLSKLGICREYHIQPSEIDRLTFAEYEIMLNEIQHHIKEQEKQNEQQQKEMASMKSGMNPNNMKMPSMSNMKMPSMPTVSVPKF